MYNTTTPKKYRISKGSLWCVSYKINITRKVSSCLMDYMIHGYLLDYGFIKELFLGGIFQPSEHSCVFIAIFTSSALFSNNQKLQNISSKCRAIV